MKKFWIFAGVLTLGAGVLVWGAGQGWFDGQRDQVSIADPDDKEDDSVAKPISRDEAKAELAGLLGVEKDELVDIGENFSRPKRDLAFDPENSNAKRPRKSVFANPGRAPFLKGDENPQVAGLMAEITNQDKDKQDELRVAKSTFFAPEPFDREKYEADPETYLNKIRPGRVFQPAQPGPDVKQLTAMSPAFTSVLQGEAVQLKVQADPGVPVAFHTQETGTFDNKLKTITVAANKDGIAEAKFTLGPGTSGLLNVLAASPVHSQQVKFTVRVALPDSR